MGPGSYRWRSSTCRSRTAQAAGITSRYERPRLDLERTGRRMGPVVPRVAAGPAAAAVGSRFVPSTAPWRALPTGERLGSVSPARHSEGTAIAVPCLLLLETAD